MAMIRVGMGAAGETAVTTTPPPPPMGKLDQFVAGAKTWMSPSQIPAALKAVVSVEAWKAAPMALVGLLSVPAALLLVVLGGMGVAKRRRAKNPRRGQVVVRRPRKPASWTCGHCGRRVSGQYDVCQCGDTRKWARASNPRRRRRTANPRRHGRRRNPSAKSTRRKIYARRKKNPRFHVAKYGTQGGVNYWGVYDGQAHKFVSPATRNYHAQVKLAGRMNRDEPSYGAQKKAAAYAKRRIGRIANPRRKRKPKTKSYMAEWQEKATALARAYGESPGRFGGKGPAKRRPRKR